MSDDDPSVDAPRFCTNCGSEAVRGDSFCGDCGQSLSEQTPSQPDAQPPTTSRSTPAADAAYIEHQGSHLPPKSMPLTSSVSPDSPYEGVSAPKKITATQKVLIAIAVVVVLVGVGLAVKASHHSSAASSATSGSFSTSPPTTSAQSGVTPAEAFQAGERDGQGQARAGFSAFTAQGTCETQSNGQYPGNPELDAQFLDGCIAGYNGGSVSGGVGPNGQNNISGAPGNAGMMPNNGG